MASNGVTMTCNPVAGASRYEFAVEVKGQNGAFSTYYTWVGTAPSRTFWPQTRGTTYRFRVRAEVGGTFRGASAAAAFDVR